MAAPAPSIPQCAICCEDIDARDHVLVSNDIYGVLPRDDRRPFAVHLLCWQIRQIALAAGHTPPARASAAAVDPRTLLPRPAPKCGVCLQALGQQFVRFGGCAHPAQHFACFCMTSNPRRKLLCDECPQQAGVDAYAAEVDRWTRLPVDGGYQVERAPDLVTNVVVSSLYPRSVVRMVEDRLPIGEIMLEVAHFHARGDLEHPTAARQLTLELQSTGREDRGKDKPRGYYRSPLVCLHDNGYGLADAERLGLTFEMLFESDLDWEIVLQPAEAQTLVSGRLGATFTRLLLAGCPLDDIIAAGYTPEDLRTLRFAVRPFLAAGGTREQLCRLLKVDRLEDVEQRRTFGLHSLRLNEVQWQ